MQKITPCLWLDNNVEDAISFYSSGFKNTKVKLKTYYGEAASQAAGQKIGDLLTALVEIEGKEFLFLNGGPHFKPTPCNSFFITCENEKEIDGLWEKLSQGGEVRIPLQKYPFAEKYGWCEDRFGFSWQLIIGSSKDKISPAFLFANKNFGKAEEAMKLYTSLFKNSKIEIVARDEKSNAILHAKFTLAGEPLYVMEGPLEHHFEFNPAVSMVVKCDTQNEIDAVWAKLSANKDFEQCGWLQDKFGISWQIVPTGLEAMLTDPNPERRERVTAAVMKMKKLDLASLEKAFGK